MHFHRFPTHTGFSLRLGREGGAVVFSMFAEWGTQESEVELILSLPRSQWSWVIPFPERQPRSR